MEVQYSKIKFKLINISHKLNSVNRELTNTRNMNFESQASSLFKIRAFNIPFIKKKYEKL